MIRMVCTLVKVALCRRRHREWHPQKPTTQIRIQEIFTAIQDIVLFPPLHLALERQELIQVEYLIRPRIG
jgi:hypothetical protein